MGIIYFEGGPLNGYAYETSALLGPEALELPVIEYLWTSEKKTSQATGAVAQIWRHKSVVDGSAPATSAQPTPQAQVGAAGPDDATRIDVQGDPPRSAGEDAAAETNDTAATAALTEAQGELDMTNLLERRKALKLSRAQLSEETGLAQSKIIAIETNSGKRVKQEERETLARAIAGHEVPQSVGSVAGARA